MSENWDSFFESDGKPTLIQEESEAEKLAAELRMDCGLKSDDAEKTADWILERYGRMDRPENNRENLSQKFVDVFSILIEYAEKPRLLPWVLRSMLYVFNNSTMDDLIGGETPADWWRKMGHSKTVAFRLANDIAERFGLPHRGRSEKSRHKMSMRRREIKKEELEAVS